MSDSYIQVAPDSSGKKVDASELVVNAETVQRQRFVIADDADAFALAAVLNAEPDSDAYGVVVRVVAPAQGDSSDGVHGPMVQGVVNETPEAHSPGEVRPLSLTTDGRVRVSATQANTSLNFFESSLGDCPGTEPASYKFAPGNNPYGF